MKDITCQLDLIGLIILSCVLFESSSYDLQFANPATSPGASDFGGGDEMQKGHGQWMQAPSPLCLGYKMDVSENCGAPKSSILIGFSIINHPFGVPLFLETSRC